MRLNSALYKLSLLIPIFITIIGCSEPIIDSSNEQNLDNSLKKLVLNQPPSKRENTLMEFSRIENTYMGHSAFRYENETKPERRQRFLDTISGMNASAISAEANRIQQAWRLADLLLARQSYQHYLEALELLNKIKILNHELTPLNKSKSKNEFKGVISNKSQHDIYSAEFSFDIYRVNDNKFLRKGTVFLQIPSGVLPGQQKKVFASIRLNSQTDQEQVIIKNFDAINIWNTLEGSHDSLIASKQEPLISKEGLDKAENKYKLEYGSNEPSEWSKNIIRENKHRNYTKGRNHR